MKQQRRALQSVRAEILKSRLAEFAAWRLALARFWRLDLVWAALHFRFVASRRRRALLALLRAKMSPDWRDSRPRKIQILELSITKKEKA